MIFPSSSVAQPKAEGAAAAPAQPAPARAAKFIQTWVKANYDPAMRFVAYAEVAVFARVLFGALLLRNSLLAPLFYAHFLRLRFYMSSFTRGAFQHVGSILDGYTQHPSCPPAVRRGYLMLTDLVSYESLMYCVSCLSTLMSSLPYCNNRFRDTPAQSCPCRTRVPALQEALQLLLLLPMLPEQALLAADIVSRPQRIICRTRTQARELRTRKEGKRGDITIFVCDKDDEDMEEYLLHSLSHFPSYRSLSSHLHHIALSFINHSFWLPTSMPPLALASFPFLSIVSLPVLSWHDQCAARNQGLSFFFYSPFSTGPASFLFSARHARRAALHIPEIREKKSERKRLEVEMTIDQCVSLRTTFFFPLLV